MVANLPISRLVNVTVTLTPAGAKSQSLSDLLLLGTSDVIDVVERMRTYDDLAAVASDFGTSAEEYLAAVLWFQQAPQPKQLLIGRWAKTATKGRLTGGVLPALSQAMATWTVITNGGFKVSVDGGALTNITGLNFSAQTNLNGVASIITAGLTGAICVWDANTSTFRIVSNSTGASSSISFLQAPTAGTDISLLLAMRSTSSGAYVANGIAAESAINAVILFDDKFSQQFYGLVIPSAVSAEHLAVAAYIEGAEAKHYYGVTTQEAGVLSSVDTASIPYLLKQLGYKKTGTQYSSSNPYAVVSLLARILTVDYNGNNTVITLMYKQEPGIVAETLTTTQINALEAKNANVFVAYNNDTAIIETGVSASGDFIDIITGADWSAIAIQQGVYNQLYTSPTKIPQTDAGSHLLVTAVEAVCSQGVQNGLFAPGVWNSQGFGVLKQGDYLSKGFYTYVQPMALQNTADRAARKAPPIRCAVKLAGAIHTADIAVEINR